MIRTGTDNMFQRHINHNVDYLYKLQINETEHQNHRLSWILAIQAILFAGLCALLSSNSYEGSSIQHQAAIIDSLIAVFMVIGILLSISGVYSMLVGELAIGTVLECWDEYDRKHMHEKCNEIPHQVILSPCTTMKSPFKVLLIYSFAPKVFCAGWISLAIFFFVVKYSALTIDSFWIVLISIYLCMLLAICIITAFVGKYMLYHWYYKGQKKRRKEDEKDVSHNTPLLEWNLSGSCIETQMNNKCRVSFNSDCYKDHNRGVAVTIHVDQSVNDVIIEFLHNNDI